MELYHIHLLGNHDKLYKEGLTLNINKNNFNNRLYNRIYNMNPTVESKKYQEITDLLNYFLELKGWGQVSNRISLSDVIGVILTNGSTDEELNNILTDAREIIHNEWMGLREMAIEEYRKENCPTIPSRLHSLFATDDKSLEFWINNIAFDNTEIYRIDVIDEPFISNESLLPDEGLPYGEKVKAAYKYFNPRKRDLNGINDEYLVQGKVKLLERIK